MSEWHEVSPQEQALARALQSAADALMAAAVNHQCPRAREAANAADRVLAEEGWPHPDPFSNERPKHAAPDYSAF